MKPLSLAIACLVILSGLRFLTLAPAPIDPCNPPLPKPASLVAANPVGPVPSLAPAPPQHTATPAHVLYVTVEAELKPISFDGSLPAPQDR